jgi:N-acyl-L-homoserine lactone synthetase
MIKVIPGERRDSYPRLIDEMYKLRRGVFHERLQWQVQTWGRCRPSTS